MVFDPNTVVAHVRRYQRLPARAVLPFVVVGELKALALEGNRGYQRVSFPEHLLDEYLIATMRNAPPDLYALTHAFSQGKLPGQPLPRGMSARNVGKNDLWIAATALDLDIPLHTADRDFDHLTALGLELVNEPVA